MDGDPDEVRRVLRQIEEQRLAEETRRGAPEKAPRRAARRPTNWRRLAWWLAGGTAALWALVSACSESDGERRIRALENDVQQLRGRVGDLESVQHSHSR